MFTKSLYSKSNLIRKELILERILRLEVREEEKDIKQMLFFLHISLSSSFLSFRKKFVKKFYIFLSFLEGVRDVIGL